MKKDPASSSALELLLVGLAIALAIIGFLAAGSVVFDVVIDA